MVVMIMMMVMMIMGMMMMRMMMILVRMMMVMRRKRKRRDHASYPMRSSGYRALSPLYSSKARSCQQEGRQCFLAPIADDVTGRSCHSERRGKKDVGHS